VQAPVLANCPAVPREASDFTFQVHGGTGRETSPLDATSVIHNLSATSFHTLQTNRRRPNQRRHSVVRRVRELLRAQIVDAGFPDGVLPSEFRLVREYGVSRGVIREVLALLREEGLIERLQGAGTFVAAQQRSPVGIDAARTLAEGLNRGASRVSWELLDAGHQPSPPLVAERLDLVPGDEVVFLERLTALDGYPLIVRSSWFPLPVAAPLLKPGTEYRFSVYDLIEQVLGRDVAYARLRVEATRADAAIAPVLGLKVGAPVQLMERVVYGSEEQPIEYSVGRARGDRFVLTTEMSRQPRADTGDQRLR
jgi:GntR family transcriptional regulator